MATLIIRTVQANPVRLKIELNGVTYLLEYPDKQAALDDLLRAPDETDLSTALRLVLKEWKKTDANFNNLAGLVNKSCTVTLDVTIS